MRLKIKTENPQEIRVEITLIMTIYEIIKIREGITPLNSHAQEFEASLGQIIRTVKQQYDIEVEDLEEPDPKDEAKKKT